MWDSVLLNDTFGLALLKSAISSGDIKLITPETESERQQLGDLKSRMNRTRTDKAALTYALLAETVWIDGSNFSWEVFREFEDVDSDDDLGNLESRPFIASASQDFCTFVQLTMSGTNYVSSGGHDQPAQERANLYASLEPLIWHSFRRSKQWQFLDRSIVRRVLDIIVMESHLVDIRRRLDDREFDDVMLEAIKKYWPKSNLSKEEKRLLQSVAYVAMVKGDVAANTMEEAKKRKAVYPVMGLSFGRDRRSGQGNTIGFVKSQDVIAATRIFLSEIQNWPYVTEFSDILRLRENKHFGEFRAMLKNWVSAILAGDRAMEQSIRNEIRSANAALSTSVKCTKAGKFFTYIGLPLLVVDAVFGPVCGTVVTFTGFGLQTYSDWIKAKHKWLIVGE